MTREPGWPPPSTPAPPGGAARPRRAPGASHADVDATGETVVLDAAGARAAVLSPIGAVVWLLCDGSHDVDEIARLIAERFPTVEAAAVRRDVEELLARLRAEGLVVG